MRTGETQQCKCGSENLWSGFVDEEDFAVDGDTPGAAYKTFCNDCGTEWTLPALGDRPSRKRNGKRTARPWKVWVRDIGPTFNFATEDRARARAAQLVAGEIVIGRTLYGPYAEVLVWGPADLPSRRWTYRPDGDPVEETFRGAGWQAV